MMAVTPARKNRSKNFSDNEICVLVEGVFEKREVLFGALKGPNLTQHHRDRAWFQVQQAVNAVATVVRSVEELKSKFKDLKKRTKKRANDIVRESKRTGGGENNATPLTDWEEKVLTFIGVESIEGIKGGVDTYKQVIPPVYTSPEPAPLSSTPRHSPNPSSSLFTPGLNVAIVPNYSSCIEYPLSPILETAPNLLPGTSSNPVQLQVVVDNEKPVPKRKKLKSVAVDHLKENNKLLKENNEILTKLLGEFQEIKELKKRKLSIMEEILSIKKKKKL